MDKSIEENACRAFFGKNVHERLAYELCSKSKRREFLKKISHTAESYIKPSAVVSHFEYPPDKSLITEFLKCSDCYVISHDKNDGSIMPVAAALDELFLNGMAYMLISHDCERAYLEAENEFVGHPAFFLGKETKKCSI